MDNNVEHIGTHIIQNQIKTLQNVYSFVVNQIEDKNVRGRKKEKSLADKQTRTKKTKRTKEKRRNGKNNATTQKIKTFYHQQTVIMITNYNRKHSQHHIQTNRQVLGT